MKASEISGWGSASSAALGVCTADGGGGAFCGAGFGASLTGAGGETAASRCGAGGAATMGAGLGAGAGACSVFGGALGGSGGNAACRGGGRPPSFKSRAFAARSGGGRIIASGAEAVTVAGAHG